MVAIMQRLRPKYVRQATSAFTHPTLMNCKDRSLSHSEQTLDWLNGRMDALPKFTFFRIIMKRYEHSVKH
jgi:hypothetical protein